MRVSTGRRGAAACGLLGGLIATALLGGCASGRAYFAPSETRATRLSGEAVPTRYMVPQDAGASGMMLHAEARAFDDPIGEGTTFPTLQIRLWIHNDTDQRLELRLAECSAEDDLGNRFTLTRGRHQGASTTVVILPGRRRSSADLFFNLPLDYDVHAPEAVTLRWSLRIGDQEYRQTTSFKRSGDRAFHDPFLQMPMGL